MNKDNRGYDYPQLDYMTQTGASLLADMINDYWMVRGRKANARVECESVGRELGTAHKSMFVVRSNITGNTKAPF